MAGATNIYRLGIKELWSLLRDPIMLLLIVYSFSFQVYVAATAMPEGLSKVPIAVVDEDDSPLSARIVRPNAFCTESAKVDGSHPVRP